MHLWCGICEDISGNPRVSENGYQIVCGGVEDGLDWKVKEFSYDGLEDVFKDPMYLSVSLSDGSKICLMPSSYLPSKSHASEATKEF